MPISIASFRSTKSAGHSTPPVHCKQPFTAVEKEAEKAPDMSHDDTRMAKTTESLLLDTQQQAKPLDQKKKKTRNIFGRLSNRFSLKPQPTTATPTLVVPSSTTPIPQASLSKTLSHDPLMAPFGPSSSPSHHLSPPSRASLLGPSCDESGLLYRPKNLIKNSDCPSTHTTQQSFKRQSTPTRASKFFRKRLSLSSSVLADGDQEPVDRAVTPEVPNRSPVEESTPTSLSSDGHPSSIMSSELSSANETAETSLTSADEADREECGLAGIGVRNRMSVCLHSLPIHPSVAPQLAGLKPPVHPAMRYVPSSSSPLSSGRLAEPFADNYHSLRTPSSSKRLSTQSYVPRPHSSPLSPNDKRMSFGHLGLVPNQSAVDSQTLMRLLRGPSSYPEETLPRANSQRESIYVPCA